MSTRKEYIDSLTRQMDSWRAQLGEHEKAVANKSKEAQDEFTEAAERLENRFKGLEEEIEKARTVSDDAWEATKAEIEKSWKKANEAVARALSSISV